jgi:hypothetical protein
MVTKKTTRKTKKNYIILEKYETNIIGIITHVYIIHLNSAYNCKKNITIKSNKKKIGQVLFKELGMDYLTENKISTTKLYKNDKNMMEKLKKIIDPTEKYTYCVNKDKLILAETKTKTNESHVKNMLSKHILLCDDSACASGEVIIHKDTFVFDNSSGTFEPSIKNLQILKKVLPFLKVKIMNMNSKIHEDYFKAY